MEDKWRIGYESNMRILWRPMNEMDSDGSGSIGNGD
jgi:hypothetical protein